MNTKAYRFAGCNVRLISDTPVFDSELFGNFRYDDCTEAECDIEITVSHSALPPKKGALVFSDSVSEYYTLNGCGYYYSSYPFSEGVREFACRVTRGEKITLFVVPGQRLWDSLVAFAVNYTQLLFVKGTATLHTSCIDVNGKAVLFCGDKGAGKSTQAMLWNRCRGAEIINGDRIAVSVDNNGITAHGIPFCGSSKIAVNRSLPVKAVVFPVKAQKNALRRLGTAEAFKEVLGRLTYYPEDIAQLNRAADIAGAIAEKVPAFCLMCTPDEGAVNLLEEQLCQI